MAERLPELHHIDMNQVAVAVAQARTDVEYGALATLTPLRFQGGRRTANVAGQRHRMQSVVDERGREVLYVLSVFLPRFLDGLSVVEKLETVVHELWHVGPRFDGDLRRYPGRCYAHGRSEKEYDAHIQRLTRRWLQQDPPSTLYDFLHGSFSEVRRRYGAVVGWRFPHPKLVPVSVAHGSQPE